MWGFGDSLLGVKAKAEPPKQLLPERLRPAVQGWGAQPGGHRLEGLAGLHGRVHMLVFLSLD